eukprot:Phypoly_transcript_00890.p1 GENE.Phypoly_transcript_00890~~Phypoly_transcript_00890.p1  ORF type:complete len:1080 (+),score=133.98 Phypoly_transcript_00890:582-3821(+)
MALKHDPLLFAPNHFDADELRRLRKFYGYGLITKENLSRHLSVLSTKFPFLIDAMVTTCNGGTYHHTLHSDAWISLLSKITYGTPTDLSLLCFELCSNGAGRVHHKDVLRLARAARYLIQNHPLASYSGAANTEQSSQGDSYLVNVPSLGAIESTTPQQEEQPRPRSLISEKSFIDPKDEPAQQERASQGFQAGGPPPSDPSGGLPPNAALSTSGGVSQGTGTGDISVSNGNLNPDASASAQEGAPDETDEFGEDQYSRYASIPGIATRNGGFEALAFPDDLVDYIFSAEKAKLETKQKGESFLSYNEFLFKAKFIPELSRCFGLFDFLYFLLVAPYKTTAHQVTFEGYLKVARKKQGVQRKYHRCYVLVRDRFLIVTKEDTIHPWISLPLWHCTTHIGGYRKLTIAVESAKTHLRLHPINTEEAVQWVDCIRKNSRGNHVYDSFAQPRKDNICKWFVNAKAYYKSLMSIITKAEKQILIIGWAITPFLRLDRHEELSEEVSRMCTDPNPDPTRSRVWSSLNSRTVKLIDVLLERARAGVMIRILVWNETNWGFMLDSHKVKHILEGIHPNIEVVRHPSIVPIKWTHHQKMVVIDQRIAFLGGIDLVVGRYDDKWSRVCDMEGKIFPGNDYNNLILGGTEDGDPNTTKLDRSIQPRLPWHDTAVCVVGETAYDAATSFIQVWNHAVFHVIKSSRYTRLVPHPYLYQELLARPDAASYVFDIAPNEQRKDVSVGMTCQIIRSGSPWAFGQTVEASYYRAILDTIRKARHYVYIQNQYFISSVMHSIPGNKISLAIVERISLAIRTNRKFRVYIVLPIHQAGPIDSVATRAIVKWTRHSIFRGKESICGRLRLKFPDVDPMDYISVCALRNWQVSNGITFTEMVYVHSKLVIADDQVAIIGSGNINDRSMRGARDSEVGVLIGDGEQCDSVMDGEPFRASRFVRELRLKLWRTHLGLNQMQHGYPLAETRPLRPRDPAEEAAAMDQMVDPVADATFYNVWKRTAQWNSRIFSEVFGDALVENWSSVRNGHRKIFRSMPQEDIEKLGTVHGHLIEFPANMLNHDNNFTLWMLTKRLKLNVVV